MARVGPGSSSPGVAPPRPHPRGPRRRLPRGRLERGRVAPAGRGRPAAVEEVSRGARRLRWPGRASARARGRHRGAPRRPRPRQAGGGAGGGGDAAARLAGRAHEVVTGVCLVHGASRARRSSAAVRFAPMSEAEMSWYASTGEPLDKAGGYHVDGRGRCSSRRSRARPSNVAGLPVRLVLRLAREAGLDLGWPA
ncbi:MAG: Maf family protein [Vicinamibacteria bacterium]